MTDSKIIARLIYRAHVKPEPPVIDLEFDSFANALEFYAKTRMRELIEEGRLELLPEPDAEPAPPDLPEPTPEPADTHAHTHTHTQPDPLRAKALRPSSSPEKDRARKKKSLTT